MVRGYSLETFHIPYKFREIIYTPWVPNIATILKKADFIDSNQNHELMGKLAVSATGRIYGCFQK